MKKIIALAAVLLLTVCAFAQDGKRIYDKYSDAENVSAVYISSSMFRMMGRLPDMDVNGLDISPLISGLNGFYMLNSENPSVNASLRSDAENFITKGKYEMLMETKDNGETVRIYTIGDEKTVTNFVMLALEKTEITFISIEGKMSRKDLEKALSDKKD